MTLLIVIIGFLKKGLKKKIVNAPYFDDTELSAISILGIDMSFQSNTSKGQPVKSHSRQRNIIKTKKPEPLEGTLVFNYQSISRLLDSLPVLISYVDSKKRYCFNNKAYEDWFGRKRESILGRHVKEVLGTTAYQTLKKYIDKALSGKTVQFEDKVPYKDGGTRYIKAHYIPDFDPKGKVKGFFVLVSDITERKNIEEDLKNSEERFRQIAENIKEVLWVISPDGEEMIYVSPMYEEIWGQTCKSLYENPRNWMEAIHPEDREQVENNFKKKLMIKSGFNQEYRVVRPDGSIRWIWDRGFPVHNQQGEVYRIAGIAEDVTESKNREKIIRDQNQLFEMVAKGRPLQEILDTLCAFIENQENGLLASILLLDETGKHLRHGSAPSLSNSYIDAINGIAIGPKAGSCGTAVFKNEMVVAENIAEDPLWTDIRDIALQHGLRACWSTPIRNTLGEVLGTFALYYKKPCKPTDFELNLIETATHIAGIAIEQHQANETIKRNESRYRNICGQLRSIAEETSAATGELFFRSLVRSLSSTLKVRYAIVGKINKKSKDTIQTLAVWGNNQLLENFEYSFLGGPCETVINDKLQKSEIWAFPKDVQKSFPGFTLLSELGVESYLGVAISDSSGTMQGVLVIMHDQQMEESAEIHSLLKTYAVRAQKELERLQIEFTLKEAHDNLLAKVKNQTQDLLSKNEQLQQEITERKKTEEIVQKALKEKEILLKELSHRTKNNLQIINSLLHLQAMNIPDKKYSEMFRDCSNRIRSMGLVHEKIFGASDLAGIDFSEYIRSLTTDLFHSYGVSQERIELRIHAQKVPFDIDVGVYLGLIINELVSNALKYAFPDNKEGRIDIALRPIDGNKIELLVKDSGDEFPKDLDIKNNNSLGLSLVKTLVEDQLHGTLELKLSEETQFKMIFPEKSYN